MREQKWLPQTPSGDKPIVALTDRRTRSASVEIPRQTVRSAPTCCFPHLEHESRCSRYKLVVSTNPVDHLKLDKHQEYISRLNFDCVMKRLSLNLKNSSALIRL